MKHSKIEFIYNQEQLIGRRREYLVISFFLITIVFFILYYFKAKEAAATWLMIQYCIYALLLISGYIWYSSLGKKLDSLWNKKIQYINRLNNVE